MFKSCYGHDLLIGQQNADKLVQYSDPPIDGEQKKESYERTICSFGIENPGPRWL